MASDWRPATPDDAALLTDLERAANLATLGHVFPPDLHPYPYDAVLARWRRTLVEPGVRVDVRPGPDGLAALAAYDTTTLRHLAVHPGHWGAGLAREAAGRATAAIRDGGAGRALLWCLRENHNARGFYAHLGWRATGLTRAAEWVPHPEEMEYELDLGPS
ncbi:MAG: family N-acetyltransferase [Nocardioides sp.]|nr:family N-acetyltransferase [Nocardioides sp.]